MYIDPHVHCRDWKQARGKYGKFKETVEHALRVAESVGVNAIFDMPNTNPPIISRNSVIERLSLAEKANSPVFYGLYMGLTADLLQTIEAIETYKEFQGVVGFKLFAGHSVGDLAIIEEEKQNLVYETLSDLNYEGMLVVHCEKESFMKPELWNPEDPKTHSYARPPEAEVESVKKQIGYAILNGFKGNLHIAHISVPEAVRIVKGAREMINISCGTTPHHCLLNNNVMDSENGILYKMNPPLRDEESASQILQFLKDGSIDYLETDHAPHTLEENIEDFMSGIPNLPFIPIILDELRKRGFTEERIKEITHTTISRLFGIELEEKELKIGEDFSKDYAFNPYEILRK